jgi:purine catabolism regulator
MSGAECRSVVADRTDRPDAAGSFGVTIADVLRLDAVTVAAPEVLAGSDQLGRPVRWVHVTATESVAGLVSGGELLLSTGVGWPALEQDLDGYVGELQTAGVAGLILELGARYPAAPAPLVRACEARDIPLIVLHRQARFIAITEAVHSRIITDQTNALQARDDVHAMFTELSLRGSPADFIVTQLGRALGSPVVLEDLAHRVIAAETLDDDGVLAGWEPASRAAHRRADAVAPAAGGSWLIVPVEARGTRWGYLVALPGPAHPAGRSNVLEQGAVALALSRLADHDDEWILRSQRALLDTLLGGRYRSEFGLRARFEASGLPIKGRRLVGIAIGGNGVTPAAVRAAAGGLGADLVIGVRDDLVGGGAGAILVAALSVRESEALSDAAIRQFAERIAADSSAPGTTLALGSGAHDIRGLLSSLDEATELLGSRSDADARGATVLRAEDKPLLRLVTALAGDPRLQAHSEQMLRPLIEHDLATGGDLLDVLGAYLAHPGNRTTAAAASHLSRSVFYQRIALIEDLLGADLDDGETLSALHAALFARRRAAH